MRYVLALAAATAMLAGPAFADGDAAKGEKVFKKCQACHTVGEDAKAKVGPVLNDIFGTQAGVNEEFGKKYSKAMIKAGEEGLVWDEANMAEYLIKPRSFMKGTKMAFAGLKKEDDRENVIAYLLQFSPDYTPGGEAGEGESEAEEASSGSDS